MAMSREDVIWVYRIFLGREPDNDAVINHQVNNCRTRLEMIDQILESEEFKSKHIVR